MIDMNLCFQKNKDFVFRRIENETILVPIKDNVGDMGCIYNLNEMGALIWELLDGKIKLETIKEKIIDAYEVSPQEADADLTEFVTDLIEIEAIKLIDCPPI